MSQALTGHLDRSATVADLTNFYLEEIRKHQLWLQCQRESCADRALGEAEAALGRVVAQLERLCMRDDAPVVVGSLLKQLDVVTGLSVWSPPQKYH
jgi:hypothetical protein